MKKRIPFLLLLTLFISINLFSQISEGGIPPSFKLINTKSLSSPSSYIVNADKKHINRLFREEAFDINKTKPSPIATAIPVEYDLIKDGKWTSLQDGSRICQLNIIAPDALGIILAYSKFYIPEGNKLFIYNKDHSQILGAYTCSTNPNGGSFSTEIIYGDELTLEYVEYFEEPANINISSIGYGYQGIINYTKASEPEGFNTSKECQVNINCTEGADWQIEKKGVARIYALIGSTWYRSTGSLINNTNNDKTPLFITAAHCIKANGRIANMSNIQFYFNYEFAGCVNEKEVPQGYNTMVGAEILVLTSLYGGSDGALLKLNDQIPDNYDVYFNGWDISEQPSKKGVVIHHPNGDVKKITTYNTPLATGTYSEKGGTSMENAHWAVQYTETTNGFGTTEKGSSGSPIFSQDKLIVGTLTGGTSSCNNKLGIDYYGKISYHWDKNSTADLYMKPFLDPIEANVKKMAGLANIENPIDPPIIDPEKTTKDAFAYWSENGNRNRLEIRLDNEDTADFFKKVTITSMGGYDIYRNSDIKYDGSLKRIHSVTTTGWPNGLYIVHLETTKGKRYSFKIIK